MVLCLVTTLLLSAVLGQTKPSSLGESFNMHKIEVEGALSGGKKIYTELVPSCFITETLQQTNKHFKEYTDHEDFIHEIAASVGLTAKEIGGKGSINTKYLRKSSTDTSGMLVEVIYLRSSHIVSDECLEEAPLDPNMLKELGSVPYPVHKPHDRISWRYYDAFIHRWGSHILKSTQSGAKAIYHMSKTKRTITNKKELLFKLCAKLPELNLDGCVDMGPKTSSTSDSADESTEAFILGGTRETQDKLREGNFTQELLDKLSSEAADNPAPIKHTWISLPELLNSRILTGYQVYDEELVKRSIALLSYYKGYHVFGCDHQVKDGKNITIFVNEGDDDNPDYQCLQVRSGCQQNSDCVNWPVKLIGPCYCAGISCMALKKDGVKQTKSNELVLRLTLGGTYNDVTNGRCYWSKGGCTCDTRGDTLREVWPLGSVLLQAKKPTKPIPWALVAFILVLVVLGMLGVYLVIAKKRRRSAKKKL